MIPLLVNNLFWAQLSWQAVGMYTLSLFMKKVNKNSKKKLISVFHLNDPYIRQAARETDITLLSLLN